MKWYILAIDMEFIIFLGLLIVGIYGFNAIRKNSPAEQLKQKENLIDKLNIQAEWYFSYILNKEKELLEGYKKNKDKYRVLSSKDISKGIDQLEEILKKYLTVRERMKHSSLEERHSLAKDWFDLTETLYLDQKNAEHHNEFIDFYSMPVPKEEKELNEKNRMETGIQVQEIIKRINRLYAANN